MAGIAIAIVEAVLNAGAIATDVAGMAVTAKAGTEEYDRQVQAAKDAKIQAEKRVKMDYGLKGMDYLASQRQQAQQVSRQRSFGKDINSALIQHKQASAGSASQPRPVQSQSQPALNIKMSGNVPAIQRMG